MLAGLPAARLRFLTHLSTNTCRCTCNTHKYVRTPSARVNASAAPRIPHHKKARVLRLLLIHYEIDDDESKHELRLDEYGHQEVPNSWVLLEETTEEA